ALARLGDLLSTALPPESIQPELADHALAAARLLASAHAQAYGGWRTEAEREFVRRIDRLSAEEALRLAGQLPDGARPLLANINRRVPTAVLAETYPLITGRSGRYPVRAAEAQPDGRLRVTPHRGAPRELDQSYLVRELANLVAQLPDLPTIRA